jgi:TPR repeat protein
MHERGRGVPASNEEAMVWYAKAAKSGNLLAAEALRRLEDASADKASTESLGG